MAECLFCKIRDGEIPSTKVYEDENVYAFLDINPNNPGHTLVIPKNHTETFLDASSEDLQQVAQATQKIGQGLIKGVNAEGFNIQINVNEAAGQQIFHLHWHVIPRWEGDGLAHWPHKEYKEDEAETYAEKIRNNIHA